MDQARQVPSLKPLTALSALHRGTKAGLYLRRDDELEVRTSGGVPPECTETSHRAATCSRALWDRVWSGSAGWGTAGPPREPPAGSFECVWSELQKKKKKSSHESVGLKKNMEKSNFRKYI